MTETDGDRPRWQDSEVVNIGTGVAFAAAVGAFFAIPSYASANDIPFTQWVVALLAVLVGCALFLEWAGVEEL